MLIRTRLSDDPFTRLFESMFAPIPLGGVPGFGAGFPALNIWEDGDSVYCEAELPGVCMEDLELSASADELHLKGSRRLEQREKVTVLRRERMTGTFERTVSLPAPIDVENIQATLRDGVLTVTMPKAASVRARRIAIQGAGS